MAETKTWYRPGLVFKANQKAVCHQEVCRSRKELLTVDGTVYDEVPELLAEFGIYGDEYSYIDADGFSNSGADIRGGWFNLDIQAEEKEWGPEEKEIVARHMLRQIENPRLHAEFELWSAPPVGKPWPTIDTTHPKQIPVLAAQLGLASEALSWVRENKPQWTECVDKLQEQLEAVQQDAVVEESLTAV